ncbi:hypothetical protein MBGDF03_01095 [Thermoplasmatales archaeon SCGC AB-540-F20]|nr:hypothetical protein MBGDF03_01095 [Thermoplasmatales archaeon SCGC AB-540-F20]
MVYKHGDWQLNVIETDFKNIGKRKMYFFSKKTPKRGKPCDMPEGYKVGFSSRSGLPYLQYVNKISLYQRNKQARLHNK